jgi:hypothetical protein
MQAVCDANRKFLYVEIQHPGSTSDYLAFATSGLMRKLETPGFLAPELAIFGDNAYVNTPYMASPFKGVSSGPEDAYNFFQSQLRIVIECAFGMLVHRWGILRKAMPNNISIARTGQLVISLCKLHNFCIDERQCSNSSTTSSISSRPNCAPEPLADDVANIALDGGLIFPRFDRQQSISETGFDSERDRVDALLDGGHHFDDVHRFTRERLAKQYEGQEDLPRTRLLEIVVQNDYRRPRPKGSDARNKRRK